MDWTSIKVSEVGDMMGGSGAEGMLMEYLEIIQIILDDPRVLIRFLPSYPGTNICKETDFEMLLL
jgi:hypothetical protein